MDLSWRLLNFGINIFPLVLARDVHFDNIGLQRIVDANQVDANSSNCIASCLGWCQSSVTNLVILMVNSINLDFFLGFTSFNGLVRSGHGYK